MKPATGPGGPAAWTRRLLRCGLAAGPVFVTAFLLEGAVRDGYRPLRAPSRTGTVHNLAAIPVFLGMPAAALCYGRRSFRAGRPGFGLSSAGTAVTMLATMALATAGFGQAPQLVNLGGLLQRASIVTGFAWLTVLSARALRLTRDPQREAPAG